MYKLTFNLILYIVLLQACSSGPKHDPLATLRKKAEKSICTDVRGLTHTSIDALSLGLGSTIIGAVMSEKEQDSLLMKPFLPILREELKACDKKTLKGIAENGPERYRFIASILLKHRETITASVKESAEWAAPFVEIAIEKAQEMKEMQSLPSTPA